MLSRVMTSVACVLIAGGLAPLPSRAHPQPPARGAPSGLAPGAQVPVSVLALAQGAVVFEGLGPHRRAVTATPAAQAYFDQGLRLTYAFNHDEAARSFARAAELDSSCAMCFWGAALVLGPNYNVPMLASRARAAWEALQRARALAPRTTPVEQALIGALGARYSGPEPLDPEAMRPLSVAYSQAMRAVARRFPDDLDVQVLFAESMMDLRPWKLWSREGTPAPGTGEIVATLERVLARDPKHPGANHYYIHAIEASPRPERALASAERLAALMPGAGHIVHMPAHIFQRVGRYADASDTNARAIAADQAYLRLVDPPGYYPMYLGHNYGFLAFSASMEGRRATSLGAARASARAIPPAMLDMMPGMDFFASAPLLTMVRFGAWDELLEEPRPDPRYLVLTGLWLHGHGMALAARGRFEDARRDLAELVRLRERTPPELQASNNLAQDVLAVAAKVLEARIATREDQPDALALWADAVWLADRLAYAEPDDWFYPVRHYQGAALLDAGRAREAEAVYREDLRQHPNNGWALFGLASALGAQQRTEEAARVRRAFERAWRRADIALTTTAF
jgi:tetratricopeptide (TPR) repeat protein